VPDMQLPIRYALGVASRTDSRERGLTLADYASLTFEKPDVEKFPCLTLAYKALDEGGTTACAINAANEVAVAAFLDGKIKFLDIYNVITSTLEATDFIKQPTYEDLVAINSVARAKASEKIESTLK
ncbi:MAG: 1-deoxy-D-xylulose-5-phosphate reductoisomerase, partial [Paramuribaculum sp.]|nr:1-deoxy-D-xylulose-5-phosphate reductoisomerase [Paramuribaculum sp.]